jgi:hypothetical protein
MNLQMRKIKNLMMRENFRIPLRKMTIHIVNLKWVLLLS